MQQYPGERPSRSLQSASTYSVRPRTTTPIPPHNPLPQPLLKKQQASMQRATLQLLGLGILLEAYPLLASALTQNDAAKQLLLAIFVIAFVLLMLATRVGNRIAQARLSPAHTRIIFATISIFTIVFALTYLSIPAVMPHDIFLSGLYGRIVVVYHVNPYLVPLTAFPHDILYKALQGARETTPTGPVWIDLSILVTLVARESVAHVLLAFRLVGFMAHLANALLIWSILTKLKPQARTAGTLLYAWNPLVLLMSVAEMHQMVVIVLFVLLAIFLFQRNSSIVGWVFLLLAGLINPLAFLLLPLFLRLVVKETPRRKLVLVSISALVVILAYAPYWQGWGLAGIIGNIQQTFLQDNAINSLDAALLTLPLQLPPEVSWLIAPHYWTLLAAITVGSILLFGLWLADKLELLVLFSSWLFLALVIFLPTYWPWYTLLPLALALCSTGRGSILLAMLLTIGAALSYYLWLAHATWLAQGLVTVGLPLLAWGWKLFFTSTWQMTHATDSRPPTKKGSSRPTWLSRPAAWLSRPSRPSFGG